MFTILLFVWHYLLQAFLPVHLKKFAKKQAPRWAESAFDAAFRRQEGVDYMLDKDEKGWTRIKVK
jgi:hypothetical protein